YPSDEVDSSDRRGDVDQHDVLFDVLHLNCNDRGLPHICTLITYINQRTSQRAYCAADTVIPWSRSVPLFLISSTTCELRGVRWRGPCHHYSSGSSRSGRRTIRRKHPR